MTPSSAPATDTTQLIIPDELRPADGRFGCGPSKVRPDALARLAGDGAAVMGTSHRQKPVKALVGRDSRGAARAVRAARRVRGGARQRRRDGVLGRRGACGLVREPRAAPDLRRVLLEVRPGHDRRAVPGRPDRRVRRPRRRSRPQARSATPRRACRRGDVGAQRDLDRGDGPGRRDRPRRGDALVLIDATSGAGGLPVRCRPSRCVLLRAAKELRRRRRPVGGAAQPRCAAANRRPRRERALDPRVPVAEHGAGKLAQRPDLQHPGGGDAVPARRPDSLDARRGRSGLVCRAHS